MTNYLIEKGTNYSYLINALKIPSFEGIRKLSVNFVNQLPEKVQTELWEALSNGVEVLESEALLSMYMYAYGKMHAAKLQAAFEHLPTDKLEDIHLIDWGCGQAMATVVYYEYLKEKAISSNVKTITLIEPSELALKRAALHARKLFPNAEIKTVKKDFDKLIVEDIQIVDNQTILHLFSNVLDIEYFSIERLAELIEQNKAFNLMVCVSPYINDFKNQRLYNFISCFQNANTIADYVSKEWHCGWTIDYKLVEVIKSDIQEIELSFEYNLSEGTFIDEFGVQYNAAKTKLVKAYNNLSEYTVIPTTQIICDNAFGESYFSDHGSLVINKAIQIKKINLPKRLIYIGAKAFYKCNELKYTNIPDSLRVIEFGCFAGCTNLSQIEINKDHNYFSWTEGFLINKINNSLIYFHNPLLSRILILNTVEIIGKYSFFELDEIESITFSKNITKIEEYAFKDCKSLQKVNLSNRILCIENNAFDGCSKLQSIFLPPSLEYLGKSSFKDCLKLTNVLLSNSLKTIKESTFENCKKLKTIQLPDGLLSIEKSAFRECENLSDIIIPDSVILIEDFAFYKCANLEFITIPNGIKTINECVFAECYKLSLVNLPKELRIITSQSFKDCHSILEISFPESLRMILFGAFENCTSLTKICLNKGIDVIGWGAFFGCSNLREVDILNGVKELKPSAFGCCENLKDINIPESVFEMDMYAFKGCTKLVSIHVDNRNLNYTDIDGVLFSKDGTKLIYYPEGRSENLYNIPIEVVVIGDNSFSNSLKLTGVLIPFNVKVIESWAFHNCSYINSLEISDGVTKIGHSAFGGCTNIKFVVLPKSLKVIETCVFSNCVNLKEISIPPNIIEVQKGAFEQCENLVCLNFSNGISVIGENAFRSCYKLEDIDLPQTLNIIYSNAFDNCRGLKSISIRNNNMKIDRDVFAFCDQLELICINQSINPTCYNLFDTLSQVFKENDSISILRTPITAIQIYQTIDVITNYIEDLIFSTEIITIPDIQDVFNSFYNTFLDIEDEFNLKDSEKGVTHAKSYIENWDKIEQMALKTLSNRSSLVLRKNEIDSNSDFFEFDNSIGLSKKFYQFLSTIESGNSHYLTGWSFFESYQTVLSSLKSILSECENNFLSIIYQLEEFNKDKNLFWLNDLINKLNSKDIDENVKSEFCETICTK